MSALHGVGSKLQSHNAFSLGVSLGLDTLLVRRDGALGKNEKPERASSLLAEQSRVFSFIFALLRVGFRLLAEIGERLGEVRPVRRP